MPLRNPENREASEGALFTGHSSKSPGGSWHWFVNIVAAGVAVAVYFAITSSHSHTVDGVGAVVESKPARISASAHHEHVPTVSAESEEESGADEHGYDPKLVNAYASGVQAVPGAIVCADEDTVGMLIDQYDAAWSDALLDKATNGQSKLMRRSTPQPDVTNFGCALVPPGIPMIVKSGNMAPVVTVKLPNGRVVEGVTSQTMLLGSVTSVVNPVSAP